MKQSSFIAITIVCLQVFCLDHTSLRSAIRYLHQSSSGSIGEISKGVTIDQLNILVDEAKLLTKQQRQQEENFMQLYPNKSTGNSSDRKAFVIELLKLLHDQYGKQNAKVNYETSSKSRNDDLKPSTTNRQVMMNQLLTAIGADGDIRRLIDWIQNSFNLASVGEVATQFVVSKLGSVNCAALLKPDEEETLIPRFLLFNDHFVDVPFELPINPSSTDCINGKFDQTKKTILLLHGYLSGYTIVDGLTNIKNRILDTNYHIDEQAMRVFDEASRNNGSYLLTEDLYLKVRQQQYNVIIVDWFNGANPIPRSRYIRAAVNAQVVGKLVARFLSALIVQCKTPSINLQIMGHSLGCHVAGFTGKAMRSIGYQIGKITHLDPVGLCFGHLFSQPQFRLSPNDAIETQAVHVSLNVFDNPLDGAQSNFLVNGGRDQIGCGGQSELRNSTTSSVSLLYDSEAGFGPCSHLRALALFEDDLSSEPNQCQIVGYRCSSYERFLAGKCGKCDMQNNQCRLMSFPPIFAQFKKLNIVNRSQIFPTKQKVPNMSGYKLEEQSSSGSEQVVTFLNPIKGIANGSMAYVSDNRDINHKSMSDLTIENTIRRPEYGPELYANNGQGDSANQVEEMDPNEEVEDSELESKSSSSSSSGPRLLVESSQKLVQTLSKFREGTRSVLSDSFTRLSGHRLQFPTLSSTKMKEQQQQQSMKLVESIKRLDPAPIPVGSQAIPEGSVNSPLYFVGTGSVSPYCVNYYQFRMLIAEARARKLINSLAINRESHISTQKLDINDNELPTTINSMNQRQAISRRNLLHMTVKLTDTQGHFFKGFTLLEDARTLVRISTETLGQRIVSNSETMFEVTMLLNTTKLEPVRIGESIISFYFHGIILADTIEINYMSNISPEIRNRYSSVLCPVAINDKHQLVRYIECDKV